MFLSRVRIDFWGDVVEFRIVSHSRKLLSIVRSGPEAPDGMVVMCKRTENASLRDPRPGCG
jgi:hypothetical protein